MVQARKSFAKAMGGSPPRFQSGSLELPVPDVLASVESLYDDELKPFGRVLLKRLRERAAIKVAQAQGLGPDEVDPETMPRIDPKHLRRICERCHALHVEPENGREYSVMLAQRPCNFLDVCSPHDPYPMEFWHQVAMYFESLAEPGLVLPGGRYACARVLVGRQLPFLLGYSLGQVCHIVQLAISQKRILGYLEGQLVPYWHSEDWVKEQCAFTQSKLGSGALPVASWDDARACLLELLDVETSGMVTISNVKRLFRSRFQLELSETVLGHTRLFDLLSDPRFQDVCVVQAQKNGQVVVKRRPPTECAACLAPPPGVWYNGAVVPVMAEQQGGCTPTGLPLLNLPLLNIGSLEDSPLLSPGASPREPYGQQASATSWEDALCGLSPWEQVGSSGGSASSRQSPLKELRTSTSFTSTNFCNEEEDSWGSCPSSEGSPRSRPAMLQQDSMQPPVALEFEEGAVRPGQHASDELDEDLWAHLPGVSESPCNACIKNTFINLSLDREGTTSGRSCKRRSLSVPKDLGSPKNAFETLCYALLPPPSKDNQEVANAALEQGEGGLSRPASTSLAPVSLLVEHSGEQALTVPTAGSTPTPVKGKLVWRPVVKTTEAQQDHWAQWQPLDGGHVCGGTPFGRGAGAYGAKWTEESSSTWWPQQESQGGRHRSFTGPPGAW